MASGPLLIEAQSFFSLRLGVLMGGNTKAGAVATGAYFSRPTQTYAYANSVVQRELSTVSKGEKRAQTPSQPVGGMGARNKSK